MALAFRSQEGGLNVNFPLFAEKRLSQRKKLTGLLPGRLSLIGSKSFISCRPVDISRHGLGILTSERITVGTKLILKLPDQEIHLEVQWGQPDFGKKDLFRYGLVTHEQGHDLEDLFEKAGCLKVAEGNQ